MDALDAAWQFRSWLVEAVSLSLMLYNWIINIFNWMTPSAPLFDWIFNNQLWFFSYEKHEKLENSLNYICVTTKNCNSDVDVSYHV